MLRQNISRLAPAKPTVSSKMSRAKKTRNQPSPDRFQITPPYSPGVRKE
jgi:hypothetical protein